MARLERVFALVQPAPSTGTGLSDLCTRHAVRYADELILNKRDLYIPGHWEAFRSALSQENPYARMWETSHARVDMERLLDPDHRTPAFGDRGPLTNRAEPLPARAEHPMVATVRLDRPLLRDRFLTWIDNLPEGLERAKGFFRFANDPQLQEFQFSAPRTSMIGPVMLLDEPEHAIVLIGRGYDHGSVGAALRRCLADGHDRVR
jgi:G3E family GTPase